MNKESLIKQIQTLLDYMWKDEMKHYHDSDCPENHIFIILKGIRDNFELTAFYKDYDERD